MSAAARGEPRVVVIGDVIDDILVTPTRRIRRDTDTTARIALAQGGSAANAAAWLGSLGVRTDFRGRVGAGDAPRHIDALFAYGVRADIDEHPTLPTGRIVILIEGDHRSFLTDGGAARTLGAAAVTDGMLTGAAAVHLTGHSMLAAWQRAEATDLVARAAARDVPVVVDPSSAGFLRDVGPDRFLDAIAGVDALLPNLDEGRVLTGLDDPGEVAERLTQVARVVVLTLGSAGAIVARRGTDVVHVPAVGASVVDPTGAGDAFAAGFHAARVRGLGDVEAARSAAAIAGGAVAIPGGRPHTHPRGR